jgi:hypothetical protein
MDHLPGMGQVGVYHSISLKHFHGVFNVIFSKLIFGSYFFRLTFWAQFTFILSYRRENPFSEGRDAHLRYMSLHEVYRLS